MKTIIRPGAHALYLKVMLATGCCGIAAVIAFVLLVDPYGLYGIVERPGFNAVKPGLTRYQNQIKVTRALGFKPDIVLLGNSRAEIGFDPESPALLRAGGNAYNLAIPGTGIGVARGQYNYLVRAGSKPKTAILSLDFLDFIARKRDRPHENSEVPSNNEEAPREHPVDRWFWQVDSLFSLTSVRDGFRTLALVRWPEAETLSARGLNPLREYEPMARIEGYAALFDQRAREYAGRILKTMPAAVDERDFTHLRAILEQAARSGTEVKVLIYPYHAQLLIIFEQTGVWPMFEDWKRLTAAEIESARVRHPQLKVELFDFSGFHEAACEVIPVRGDRKSTTRWYWESGHFKKALGDAILKQIYLPADSATMIADSPHFAARPSLTSKLIEQNRRRIQREREQCIAEYPGLFVDTARMVEARRL